MSDLESLLDATASRHRGHLCPRQVLGVRVGMFAGKLLQLELPQIDKRLIAFVETDGCFTDGVSAASGCFVGRRTMWVLDYGKSAATFVDTASGAAIRIHPQPLARQQAAHYAPGQVDTWHSQLYGYRSMPDEALLVAQRVALTLSLEKLVSQHGLRAQCDQCGEEIINEREVVQHGRLLCRTCAGESYCRVLS